MKLKNILKEIETPVKDTPTISVEVILSFKALMILELYTAIQDQPTISNMAANISIIESRIKIIEITKRQYGSLFLLMLHIVNF